MSSLKLAVRADGDPVTLVPFLRDAVARVDSNTPLDDVMTMEARLSASVAQPRFYALFVGLFAAMALALASFGVYGILAYGVSQRRREFGVRMALGADRHDIVSLVVRQGMTLVLLGTVLGWGSAFGAASVLESLLFGVEASDPLTFVAVPALLLTVALFACVLPARRAARINLMVALRAE